MDGLLDDPGTQTQAGPPPGAVATAITPAANPPKQGPPPGAVATPITAAPAAAPARPRYMGTGNAANLTQNTNGEAVYAMQGPQGIVGVPYSRVQDAKSNGYDFANLQHIGPFTTGDPEGDRYHKDLGADPQYQKDITATYKAVQDPGQGAVIGAARGAALTAAGLGHIVKKVAGKAGVGNGDKATPAGAAPTTLDKVQEFGEGSDTGAEDFGKFVETAGEFLMGDEALKGLGYLDKIKAVTPALRALEKSPLLSRIVSAAIQQGTVGGVQGLVRSGGDPEAAATEGGVSGAFGAGGEALTGGASKLIGALMPEVKTIGGVEIPVPRGTAPKPPTPAQQAGAEAYAGEARAAVTPHIEATNAATPNPHMTWGIDEAGNFTEPVQANVTPKADPKELLAQTHDFTGASQKLIEHNAAAYDALDQFTGGKFREANDAVKAARKALDGSEASEAAYKNAQNQMHDVLDGVNEGTASANGIDLPAVKKSWTSAYQLADMGKAFDRSLNGLPGDTLVSQEQRGVNGNILDKQIGNVVRRYGIDNVRATLGPGRLENLQQIANATKTKAGRAGFNKGLLYVAHALATSVGYHAGGVSGALGAEGTMIAAQKVLNAVRTNPEIGQKLIYAIHYGASPERYAPLVAAAVQQSLQPEKSEDEK